MQHDYKVPPRPLPDREPPAGSGLGPGPAGMDAVRLRGELRNAELRLQTMQREMDALKDELLRLRRFYGLEVPPLKTPEPSP